MKFENRSFRSVDNETNNTGREPENTNWNLPKETTSVIIIRNERNTH